MIHVHKNWYIDADKHCYCLFKQTEVEDEDTGETKIKVSNKSYHSTITHCLQSFVRAHHRRLTSSKNMELDEAIEQFKKLESFVLKTSGGTEI